MSNIARNEKCPCGSGRKYKICCMNSDNFFMDVINFKGQRVFFSKNQNDKDFNDLLNWSKKLFDETLRKPLIIEVDCGLELLKEVYELFDKAIAIFETFIPCSKGCNNCCSILVQTTTIEAELIRKYILETFNSDEQQELLSKIKSVVRYHPKFTTTLTNQQRDAFYKQDIHCPFLTNEGCCSIYSVRPFGCRKHIVFSSPESCRNKGKVHMYSGGIVNITGKAITQLSSNVYRELFRLPGGETTYFTKSLPTWFARGFDNLDKTT